MKKNIFTAFLFLAFGFSAFAQDAKTIITKSLAAMNATNSYDYMFTSKERFKGVYVINTMNTKLMQTPHKVYINNIEGKNKGKELLYVKGTNKDKVLVNVAWGFSLDPFNSMLRKDNHYTILDAGFRNVKSIIQSAKTRAENEGKFDEVFKYAGNVTFDGNTCYKIEINDPTFTYENYTIKAGESLYRIAKNLKICEQLIIEKNSSLSGFDSAKEGMVIKVPTSYAKKSTLYIDSKNYHVIYQEVSDEKGIFESYSFKSLKINPTFSPDEFTTANKAYKF